MDNIQMNTKGPERYDAKIIVCATAQPECRRLIQVGKAMAEAQGVSLEILNIQPLMRDDLQWVEHLDRLYEIAREEGAQLSVYCNDFPAAVAATHVSRCHATDIVTGFPDPGTTNYFISMLHTLVPDVRINMVDRKGRIHIMEMECPATV